ncbi:MAG: NUDIX hydrolase [Bacteroidota bacterium]|nr:NUDIX hydrolase [Bacteroidota bacterium]
MKNKERKIYYIYAMPKITDQNIEYNGFLKVEKAKIEFTDKQDKVQSFSRERVNREDAAGVFIYNKESGNVILTKQFRYAVADKTKGLVLEIMAGKVSSGEDPLETALRETIEECGYKVKKENINLIASVFTSPGYTSEKIYLYYAEVSNDDRVNEGGGLEDEHEFIDVIEMPLKTLLNLVDNGDIQDSKTLLTALWVKVNKL